MSGFVGYADANNVKKTDIVNNLTSTATDAPLSAAQGKALNDKITSIGTLHYITLGNYQNSTTDWEYTGLTVTVPAGHFYVGLLITGYSAGKPIGVGIHSATTLSGNIPSQSNTDSNGVYSCPVLITPGTWYVFTKRATVPSTTNGHNFRYIDFAV